MGAVVQKLIRGIMWYNQCIFINVKLFLQEFNLFILFLDFLLNTLFCGKNSFKWKWCLGVDWLSVNHILAACRTQPASERAQAPSVVQTTYLMSQCVKKSVHKLKCQYQWLFVLVECASNLTEKLNPENCYCSGCYCNTTFLSSLLKLENTESRKW